MLRWRAKKNWKKRSGTTEEWRRKMQKKSSKRFVSTVRTTERVKARGKGTAEWDVRTYRASFCSNKQKQTREEQWRSRPLSWPPARTTAYHWPLWTVKSKIRSELSASFATCAYTYMLVGILAQLQVVSTYSTYNKQVYKIKIDQ